MRKCLIETKVGDIRLHVCPSKLLEIQRAKSEHFQMSHEGHIKPKYKVNYYYCTLIVKMSYKMMVWQVTW